MPASLSISICPQCGGEMWTPDVPRACALCRLDQDPAPEGTMPVVTGNMDLRSAAPRPIVFPPDGASEAGPTRPGEEAR